MADELYLLTADDVAFLRALRRKLDNVKGPGVLRNDGTGIVIGGGPPGTGGGVPGDDGFSAFPVKLTKVAGADGTPTTAPSWTYDVLDILTDAVLATAQAPLVRPGGFGSFAFAAYGLAYYDAEGAVKLFRAYETEAIVSCGA